MFWRQERSFWKKFRLLKTSNWQKAVNSFWYDFISTQRINEEPNTFAATALSPGKFLLWWVGNFLFSKIGALQSQFSWGTAGLSDQDAVIASLISCMMPGGVGWTGATLAGSVMGLCNIPSQNPENPVEARTQCLASGTTGFGDKDKSRYDVFCFTSNFNGKMLTILPCLLSQRPHTMIWHWNFNLIYLKKENLWSIASYKRSSVIS